MKTSKNIDIALVSLLLTLKKDSTSFLSIPVLNFKKCCQLGLPAEAKAQTGKDYETAWTEANYAILTKWVKLKHEKKPVPNLISMQSEGFEQTFFEIYWDFCSARIISLQEKKTIVETISVAITDSSNVRCLDLNLINVFMKSKKAERCTDVMFKLTLHCLSVTVEDLNL